MARIARRAFVDVSWHVFVPVIHFHLVVLMAGEAREDAEVTRHDMAGLAGVPLALVTS